MTAIAQHFRHGDAGEKMSAGSSTCDHCIHESWPLKFGRFTKFMEFIRRI
jgi:hypothetical protein